MKSIRVLHVDGVNETQLAEFTCSDADFRSIARGLGLDPNAPQTAEAVANHLIGPMRNEIVRARAEARQRLVSAALQVFDAATSEEQAQFRQAFGLPPEL